MKEIPETVWLSLRFVPNQNKANIKKGIIGACLVFEDKEDAKKDNPWGEPIGIRFPNMKKEVKK